MVSPESGVGGEWLPTAHPRRGYVPPEGKVTKASPSGSAPGRVRWILPAVEQRQRVPGAMWFLPAGLPAALV